MIYLVYCYFRLYIVSRVFCDNIKKIIKFLILMAKWIQSTFLYYLGKVLIS